MEKPHKKDRAPTITLGMYALIDALAEKGWSLVRLEAEVKAASGLGSRWVSGQRVPNAHFARLIQEKAGVEASLWGAETKRRAKSRPSTPPNRAA